ncbi:type II inositol 1,4,5-trisphosphate 5-phosphatase [Drosophila willistoni]|uniref:type II inositol 1,4,5-trisphosphate 5-phosphatase n=1 Tax=Drosophila willistoni TaxID=7260 RepID=UPI000C26C830|nr:type II inositol 1,4,5-trisphosphate 5-phosphatase [Drosophila willistoni]
MLAMDTPSSIDQEIDTLSDGIGSSMPGSGTGTGNVPMAVKSTLDIVRQRFKEDEIVHYIFEAYQIQGQEYLDRLLALVSSESGGTYAIIAFSYLRTPLTTANELIINKVFALNESFQLRQGDGKGSITTMQFDLSTAEDRPIKYYYYPLKSQEYEEFVAKVISCKNSMYKCDPEAVLNFSWLNDYRQIGEVKQELKKREAEYIVYKDIIIYCATWNVNNKPCCDSNSPLRSWLACSEKSPDIYAIGIQELDTPTKAMLNSTQMQATVEQWTQKMVESLYPGVEYEVLRSVRLVGIMLIVIVRKQLRQHILRCQLNSVARGVLNTLGNKGGVAISLQLHEGNICFVNSHLAAHMGYVDERNKDYNAIVEGMRFDDRRTISDHDHIFWLGDLNYRIQEPPGQQRPGPLTDAQTYELLLQYDQLGQEMRKGRCFDGYTEGEIKFRPTYKYDPGTDNYDSSEKQRAPAYCDRVLWKGTRIEQLAYDSIMEIRQSDHKPVYAIFRAKIKKRDEIKYKKVQEEVLKAVDKRENDNQPQITVETVSIDFGRVRFNEPSMQDFNVYNNCPLPVDFRFKEKDMHDICEKYLQVDPRQDSLMIDSARSIRIKLLVDVRTVGNLLKKIRTSDNFDILILHVENGRDIFITVTGDYQPSCFGLSMETMCRTNRPLSEYTQEQIKHLMRDESPEYQVTMPREFFLLIDYLHRQGSNLEGCFNAHDSRYSLGGHFNAVRDWLDTWSNEEFPGNVQTAAQALMLLLELPEQSLLEPFVEDLLASSSKSKAMDYIALLSAPKRNVFMHLCMFLREGILCQYYDLQQVALIFGRILLRGSSSSSRMDYNSRCIQFMRFFIDSDISDSALGNGHASGSGNIQAKSSTSATFSSSQSR